MRVLVFNCGSSSLKFDLLELDAAGRGSRRTIGRGNFEEIGPHTRQVMVDGGGQRSESVAAAIHDHPAAARAAIAWLESLTGAGELAVDAIGHRVVHGGAEIDRPTVIDAAAMHALEAASAFAPLHNPVALATIRAVAERLPKPVSVVVADTIFHHTMPEHARVYALPRALAERHGIRRFGFHGIGHAWMLERYADLAGHPVDRLNLITLHLGAGCSATAIRGGRSIDTSMGLTPLEGLMMATRSGDLDPAIVSYLCAREAIGPERVEQILNHESGLLGVSGVSSDLREIEAAAAAGNRAAALAIEMFCYRVKKYIGGYLAVLGKIDAIIFGAGIGEHSADVRARICEGLDAFGIALDPAGNRATNGREARISPAGAPIDVYVIPVDEELYIARAAARLVASSLSR